MTLERESSTSPHRRAHETGINLDQARRNPVQAGIHPGIYRKASDFLTPRIRENSARALHACTTSRPRKACKRTCKLKRVWGPQTGRETGLGTSHSLDENNFRRKLTAPQIALLARNSLRE